MNNKILIFGLLFLVVNLALSFYFFNLGDKFQTPSFFTAAEDMYSQASTQPKVAKRPNAQSNVLGAGAQNAPTASIPPDILKHSQVKLETEYGEIVIETYNQDAPLAAANFLYLTSKGFYNNLTFHRVIKNFMIQGGDPTGTGRGGPGYQFNDELNPNSEIYKNGYKKGVVAMANAGPNTNGSQFFILHQDYQLQPNYTIFGKVVQGQDVVDAIANVPVEENDKPTQPVAITKASLNN